jgi:hypothetical protein
LISSGNALLVFRNKQQFKFLYLYIIFWLCCVGESDNVARESRNLAPYIDDGSEKNLSSTDAGRKMQEEGREGASEGEGTHIIGL